MVKLVLIKELVPISAGRMVLDCVVHDSEVTAPEIEVHGHGDSLEIRTIVSVSVSIVVHPIVIDM